MNTSTAQAWTEVPDQLRDELSAPMRRWGELYDTVVAGKTVFVDEEESVRAAAAVRARLGNQRPDLAMHTRTTTYRERRGSLLWVTEKS